MAEVQDINSLKDIYKAFGEVMKNYDKYSLSVSSINEPDPLYVLRAIKSSDSDVEERYALAETLLLGHKGDIILEGKAVFSFDYTEGKLKMKFLSQPFYLQIVMDYCYGLLLKKFTPPTMS